MAEPSVVRAGDFSLSVAMDTIATDFEDIYQLSCDANDVPFMYIPAAANVSGVNALNLIGRIGLIVDNDKDVSTYVVLAQIDAVGVNWGHVSESAARNLGYSEFGVDEHITAQSNFSIYVYPTERPEWSDAMTVQQQVLSEFCSDRYAML